MKNSSIIDRPLSAQESAKPDVPPPPSPFLVKFDLTTHHLVMVGVVYLFYLGYRVLYTLNPEAFGFFLLFLYAEMRSCGVSYVRHIVDFWEQEWGQRGNRFFLEYRLEGEPLKSEEQAGAYAMALPALQSVQSPLASEVTQKMQRFFYEDGQYFQHAQDYYQNSLSLLGLLSLRTSDNLSIPSLVHELQQFSLDERETCTHRPYSLQE